MAPRSESADEAATSNTPKLGADATTTEHRSYMPAQGKKEIHANHEYSLQ